LWRYGKISEKEIGKELGCSLKTVQTHFTLHYQDAFVLALAQEGFAAEDAKLFIAGRDILQGLVLRLEDKVKGMLEAPDVKARDLKSLCSELRQCIMDLEKLQGTIVDVPQKQVNILVNNYRALSDIIFRELCPACQIKVSRAMDADEDLGRFI
jgi:hypothetical protein